MSSPLPNYFSEECVCPVCLEEYRTPKRLTCYHSLCKLCLEKMVKSTNREVIICPICRAETVIPTGGVASLPTNVAIIKLMENSPARQAKKEVKKTLKELRRKLTMMDDLNEKISNTLDHEAVATKQRIRDTTENLMDIIRKQEKALFQQVDALVRKEKEGNPMFIVHSQAAHICQAVKNLLGRDDLGELIEKKDFVMRQLKETDESVSAFTVDDRPILFKIPEFENRREFLQSVTGSHFGSVTQSNKTHSIPSLLHATGPSCGEKSKPGQSIAMLKIPLALERRFNPCALTVAKDGLIAVADQGNHCILLYNDHGVFLNQIGARGNEDGKLECPTGAVFVANDKIVVADGCLFGNPARLQAFNLSGEYVSGIVKLQENNQWFAQTSEAQDGHVIVTCRKISADYEARVKVYSSDGTMKLSFGSEGSGKLVNPVKAIYLSGEFFVSDMDKAANLCMIKVFSSKGKFLRKFAEGMLRRNTTDREHSPLIIAADAKLNQILAYSRMFKVIRSYKPDGSLAAYHSTIPSICDMVLTPDRKLLVTCDANKDTPPTVMSLLWK